MMGRKARKRVKDHETMITGLQERCDNLFFRIKILEYLFEEKFPSVHPDTATVENINKRLAVEAGELDPVKSKSDPFWRELREDGL